MNYCKIIAQDYSAAIRKCNNVSQSVCVCVGGGTTKKNKTPSSSGIPSLWSLVPMRRTKYFLILVSELDLWDLIPQQGFDWFYFSSSILFHNICIKSDTYEHLIIFGF